MAQRLNEDTFCLNYCDNYEDKIMEALQECENIVACSVSENGMNPDLFAAQGLHYYYQAEFFEEALMNFASYSIKKYDDYIKKNPESEKSFEDFWSNNKNEILKK